MIVKQLITIFLFIILTLLFLYLFLLIIPYSFPQFTPSEDSGNRTVFTVAETIYYSFTSRCIYEHNGTFIQGRLSWTGTCPQNLSDEYIFVGEGFVDEFNQTDS